MESKDTGHLELIGEANLKHVWYNCGKSSNIMTAGYSVRSVTLLSINNSRYN